MAISVNKVTLLGNVGKDPEIRTMNDGSKICNLSLATSDAWKDKVTGEKKETTEWHKVFVQNPVFIDIIEKYVRVGTKLYICGQLKTRKWTDKQGRDNYTTEVVVARYNSELILCSVPSAKTEETEEEFDEMPF